MLVVFESDTQNKLYILPMLFYCFWDNMLYLSPLWKGVGARKGWQGASYVLTSHFWHKYIEKAEFLVWKQTKSYCPVNKCLFLARQFWKLPLPTVRSTTTPLCHTTFATTPHRELTQSQLSPTDCTIFEVFWKPVQVVW